MIQNKLTEWLNTITDSELKKDLKPNVMVSGGCIASLFLGEKVNDYDVYIKDMNVLKRLTEYYAGKFPEDLEVFDGRKRQQYLDKCEDENIEGQYYISVKNLKSDQIKIFVNGDRGGFRVEEIDADKKYQPSFFSPNAISLTDDLQIVIRFNGDNEAIHKNFDFIHATNYFTFNDGLVTNLAAMESLMTKQLVYQGSLYPLTSIIRVRKFIKRHWNIGAGELLKIMFQISQLDLTDVEVLEEQLIGVDVAYFDTLIKALRKKQEKDENFDINSLYLNEIIDRVFGN